MCLACQILQAHDNLVEDAIEDDDEVLVKPVAVSLNVSNYADLLNSIVTCKFETNNCLSKT